jgi:type VI secretion system secreted protein Hcp
MRKILTTISIVMILGLTTSIAQAAVDMFLNFPDSDLDGESLDRDHQNEIDVLAWSWDLSTEDGTKSAQQIVVKDLSVTKYVDSATPAIIMKSLLGENLGRAVLTVRKAGETPLEYIILTFSDVTVSSYSTGGSEGEDRLRENITLKFSSLTGVYVPQREDGSPGAAISFDYEIARNR